MKKVKLTPAFFQGAVSIEQTRRGLKPWRLVHGQQKLFPSPREACVERTECPSGVRLRLKTNSSVLKLHVASCKQSRFFDLVIDGEIVQTLPLAKGRVPTGTRVACTSARTDFLRAAGPSLCGWSGLLRDSTGRCWGPTESAG